MPTLKFGLKAAPLKLILIGDGAVGKTSLVKAYVQKAFQKDYLMTVGVDISIKQLNLDGHQFSLTIHDIAGQERFAEIRSIFFNGANMAIAVFDVTRRQSLENIAEIWLPQLVDTVNDPNLSIYLIANKIDLEENREILQADCELTYRRLQRNFKMLNWAGYLETSALTHYNVNEAFLDLSKAYIEKSGLDLRPKRKIRKKRVLLKKTSDKKKVSNKSTKRKPASD